MNGNDEATRPQSGWISLGPLYRFVINRLDDPAETLKMKTPAGKKYGELAKRTCSSIPEEGGLYLWGSHSPQGVWTDIYVGKSSRKKTSCLRARIAKELQAERWLFWHSFIEFDEIHRLREKVHPGRYEREISTHIRKAGSTHVLWYATPDFSDQLLGDVELAAIELLQPTANARGGRPLNDVRSSVGPIIATWKRLISSDLLAPFRPQDLGAG